MQSTSVQPPPYPPFPSWLSNEKSMPQALIDQLKSPGKLFIPVGPPGEQYIVEVIKDKDGKVKSKKLYGVMYVPLCDGPTWMGEVSS